MNYDFITSHNQFYIIDPSKDYDDVNLWDKTSFENKMAIMSEGLALGTASYGHIKLELVLLEEENKSYNIETYDHIVEGSINIGANKLHIRDCPNDDDVGEIKLKNGTYRLRFYSKDIEGVIGDEYGKWGDSYKIEIWKDAEKPVKVIKKYTR